MALNQDASERAADLMKVYQPADDSLRKITRSEMMKDTNFINAQRQELLSSLIHKLATIPRTLSREEFLASKCELYQAFLGSQVGKLNRKQDAYSDYVTSLGLIATPTFEVAIRGGLDEVDGEMSSFLWNACSEVDPKFHDLVDAATSWRH